MGTYNVQERSTGGFGGGGEKDESHPFRIKQKCAHLRILNIFPSKGCVGKENLLLYYRTVYDVFLF